MYKKLILLSGVILSSFLLCCSAVLAATNPLVSTEWLADHLNDKNMVLIDVRTETNYGVGHIPGAVNIPYEKLEIVNADKTAQYMLNQADLGALLQANGVSAANHVVVYDHGNAIGDATKGAAAIWILTSVGHANVSYVNGGFTKWTFEGRIIDNKKPEVSPGDFQANLDADKVTDLDEMVSKSKAGKAFLVDARNSNQHFGTSKRADVDRFGHIPGSVNLPAPFLTNAGINRAPATIRDLKTLEDIVQGVGIPSDKNREIIVYCNTGQYAGMDYFVLHNLLGYKNVSVYDGSMREYAYEDELPLDIYGWGHVK